MFEFMSLGRLKLKSSPAPDHHFDIVMMKLFINEMCTEDLTQNDPKDKKYN